MNFMHISVGKKPSKTPFSVLLSDGGAPKRDGGRKKFPLSPISTGLALCHWLHVPERIDYKVTDLTYKVLHGSAPRYFGPLVPMQLPICPADGHYALMAPISFDGAICQTFNSR